MSYLQEEIKQFIYKKGKPILEFQSSPALLSTWITLKKERCHTNDMTASYMCTLLRLKLSL